MSPVARVGLGWLSALGLVSVLPIGGCSAPSKGALIMAISTDMQAPKDIDVVSVYITTNGAPKFDYLGRVLPDGTVSLPSTLAIVEPDEADAQIRIRVIGFQTQPSGDANARVLRDILTTVPHRRTALLRVPLDFLDDGSGMGTLPSQYVPDQDGVPEGDTAFDVTQIGSLCDFVHNKETSINGVCTGATVDSSTLELYTESEVYGDGGLQANGAPSTCFDVATCFAQATGVTDLNPQTCAFPLPQGADPSTLNVGLVSPDTGTCNASGECYVPLPNDPMAGWTVAGSNVQLVPGVCAKLKGSVALAVATGPCGAQTFSEPVCEPGEMLGAMDAGATTDAGTVGCDGTYAIVCEPNAACGDDSGGSVPLVVSGSQGTISASTSESDGSDQPSSISVTVNPVTCQASFALPVSTATCSSQGGEVMLDLVSGAVSGLPCASTGADGSCTRGMLSCMVVRAPAGSDAGPPPAGDSSAVACAPGWAVCNGICVDVQTDMNNCGQCGRACAASASLCQGGACVTGGGPADAGCPSACVPMTCQSLGYSCGVAGDGCGGLLNCGGTASCTAPQFCGGGGFNQCGGNGDGGSCPRETCQQQGIQCGVAGDGCGGQINCGTCTPPTTCGGGGVPGQCGMPVQCGG